MILEHGLLQRAHLKASAIPQKDVEDIIYRFKLKSVRVWFYLPNKHLLNKYQIKQGILIKMEVIFKLLMLTNVRSSVGISLKIPSDIHNIHTNR